MIGGRLRQSRAVASSKKEKEEEEEEEKEVELVTGQFCEATTSHILFPVCPHLSLTRAFHITNSF